MNFKRSIALFLFSLFIAGQCCYAQDPQGKAPASATGLWSEGWYRGADGYDKAVEEFKNNKKPMFVYMSVGWCPYCRKFEKGVLSSPQVRDYMKDKIKVMIDPESGRRENALASQYGLRGFPSLYLHPPQPGRAVQLYTGVTPEEFIQQVEESLK